MKYPAIALLTLTTLLGCVSNTVPRETIRVINPIEVPPGREEEALAIWDRYAEVFAQQPGYVGTTLHRSEHPSAKFHLINVAEWESADDFMRALQSEDIQQLGDGFPPDMPHHPSVYEVIRGKGTTESE